MLLAAILDLVDVTIVNVAMPTIQRPPGQSRIVAVVDFVFAFCDCVPEPSKILTVDAVRDA